MPCVPAGSAPTWAVPVPRSRSRRVPTQPSGSRPTRRWAAEASSGTASQYLGEMASTPELIATAIERFQAGVPALAQLKLIFELELRGRGDVQMFRVEVPGPKISKSASTEDARVTVEFTRSEFNKLAEQGTVADYRAAYDAGHIKASGDTNIQKLIVQVVERHERRTRTKRVHGGSLREGERRRSCPTARRRPPIPPRSPARSRGPRHRTSTRDLSPSGRGAGSSRRRTSGRRGPRVARCFAPG